MAKQKKLMSISTQGERKKKGGKEIKGAEQKTFRLFQHKGEEHKEKMKTRERTKRDKEG